MVDTNAYLVVVSDREALAWVVTEGRMAFPADRARLAGGLRPGDKGFIYTTRGCFRNPTRDRGRVIGEATITSAVNPLDEPVLFRGRAFPIGCTLTIDMLAPVRRGLELGPLVREMHAFRVPERWSVYLRRPLLRLDDEDSMLLRTELKKVAGPPRDVLAGYQKFARVGVIGSGT